MERLHKNSFYVIALAIFIIFIVYFLSVPLLFDSWIGRMDYIKAGDDFSGLLKMVFYSGGEWRNARYASNIISGFLTRYEILMDFMNAFILTFVISSTYRVLNSSPKIGALLLGGGLFMGVSDGIYRQVYGYASILYIYPILFFLLFCIILFQYIRNNMQISKVKCISLLILSYFNACFLENVSFAFSASLFLLVIYDFVKNKKINKVFLGCLLISTAEMLHLFISIIVNHSRSLTPGGEGLLEGIAQNTKLLFIETWCYNQWIILVLLILLFLVVRTNKINFFQFEIKKYLSGISGIALVSWIIFMIINLYAGGFDRTADVTYQTDIVGIPINMWIVALGFVLINLYLLFLLTIIDIKIAAFFFVGTCSLIPIILTANVGYRISSFYVFMICIVSSCLLYKVKINGSNKIISIFLTSLFFAFFSIQILQRTGRINEIQKSRESIIAETRQMQTTGGWNHNEVLKLPEFSPVDIHVSGKPEVREYYRRAFCFYYDLDADTLIESKP